MISRRSRSFGRIGTLPFLACSKRRRGGRHGRAFRAVGGMSVHSSLIGAARTLDDPVRATGNCPAGGRRCAALPDPVAPAMNRCVSHSRINHGCPALMRPTTTAAGPGLRGIGSAGMVSARASSVIEVQPHLPGLCVPALRSGGRRTRGASSSALSSLRFSACPASMCTSTRSRHLSARTRGAPRTRRNGRLLRTPGTCRSEGPPIP